MKVPAEQAALCKLRVSVLTATGKVAEKKKAVWNYIVQTETTMGTQFICTKPDRILYVVLGVTNEIVRLPPHGRGAERISGYLFAMYGLTEDDTLTKGVYAAMRAHAINEGTRAELRRFSAYSSASQTAYLSTYTGFMWKLDGGDMFEKISPGEDEVFFIDDDGGIPVEPDIGPHGLLIERLTNLNFTSTGLGGISSELQQKALTVWLFALAFPDLMPTKPLLMVEGVQGSGKTSSLQLIQTALLGKHKTMAISSSQEADFGVLLLRSPIALLDNIDSYIDWLADKTCQYTTDGSFPKRKLYSDDDEVSIKPHSFMAVATKNPASFRREDVADRCVILRFDKRDRFTRLEKLLADTGEMRPKLFGEYIYYVNRIVAEIRAGAYNEDVDEFHRMADFAALARVVGKVLDWSEEDVVDLMAGLQDERNAFASEEDPLNELLHQWIGYKPRMGPSNIGREIAIHTLHAELNSLAQAQSITFYKTSKILTQKLRSAHIERDFIVQMSAIAGRKTYRIWRQTDAQLTSVPDEEPLQLQGTGTDEDDDQ